MRSQGHRGVGPRAADPQRRDPRCPGRLRYLPREKLGLKLAHAARAPQIAVIGTSVKRALAQSDKTREIVTELKSAADRVRAEGWTPEGIGFPGFIATQREETARNEAGYLRTVALREIDGLSAALFPKPRTLHLIKDRYVTRTRPTGSAIRGEGGCAQDPLSLSCLMWPRLGVARDRCGDSWRHPDPVRTLWNQFQKVYR